SPASNSNSGDVESVQDFSDSFGADTVLRSSDSCEVHVQKLCITRFSPVLGALIQGAINSTVPPDTKATLPVVQLPESGATLVSLLSFSPHFPPVLPSTSSIEATMELLSAAQKYEMSSVLACIRLILAQQDPPFIREDNAFRAYSLAQKYGLRQEAVQAAQLTLKKGSLDSDFQSLERMLDILPGVYLHELWMFHKRFRAHLISDFSDFGNSSASSMLKDLQCILRASSGIPKWLNDYTGGIAIFPSIFYINLIEFQKAWELYLKECECVLLPETFHAVWTAIDTIVGESMEKVSNVDSCYPTGGCHYSVIRPCRFPCPQADLSLLVDSIQWYVFSLSAI
ncbi:hypothetical protein EI94DRAFT_1730432, partial [Lactarius quietus]